MFKKIAFFALFLAVTGLFAATSVNAQRLVKGSLVKSTTTDTLLEPVPENESVNIDQCTNGGVGKTPESCGADGSTNWNNGNQNGQKSHYAEDRSIHYRAVFGGLSIGTEYTVVFGYDIHKANDANTHTIDFLNNYAADIPGGNEYQVIPCGGVAGCLALTPVKIAIPNDPNVPDTIEMPVNGAFPNDTNRAFTAWGIQAGATMQLTAGAAANERLVVITFIPTVATPVFGWSGHIGATADWSPFNGGQGAGSVSGASYHMYVRGGGASDFNGSQDLQLQTSALIAPSAADAEVTGRVTDAFGRAVSSAKLTLTNASTGEVSAVYSNTFGYYSFKDLPVGDFFVMTVQHRRYLFVSGSVSFSLEDNIAGMDFQASR